jgi:hypothetical protein
MSLRIVGIVIHTLLTDEDFRDRFAVNPMKTLADLNVRGVQLTPDEIDVFMQTDTRVWFWNREPVGKRLH